MAVDESPIPEFLVRWWRDKTPEQVMSIAAHDGRILWPDTVKKRIEAQGIKEIPCYLAVPTPIERMQAVVCVNAEVARIAKITDPKMLPLSRADAERFVGPSEWEALHTAMQMAFCIYEHATIEGRPERRLMFLPQNIVRDVGMSTLYDINKRVEMYEALEDVRINEWSPEIMDGMVTLVARCMSLAPLRVYSGSLQEKIIVEAFSELARLRSGGPSSESPSTSTPD
jgi:hypothetical protein